MPNAKTKTQENRNKYLHQLNFGKQFFFCHSRSFVFLMGKMCSLRYFSQFCWRFDFMRQKHFILLFGAPCFTFASWRSKQKNWFCLCWCYCHCYGIQSTEEKKMPFKCCTVFVSLAPVKIYFGLHFVIFAFVCNLFHNCSSPNGQSIIFDLQPKIGTEPIRFFFLRMHFKCAAAHSVNRQANGKTANGTPNQQEMMHIFSAKQNANTHGVCRCRQESEEKKRCNQPKTTEKNMTTFQCIKCNKKKSGKQTDGKKYVNHFSKHMTTDDGEEKKMTLSICSLI